MKKLSIGGQTETTTAAPSEPALSVSHGPERFRAVPQQLVDQIKEALNAAHRPEFFRLPKLGVDPYFGFGRSYYYEGEQRGYWKLVRIRERGKLRGVTLIPYDAVAAFIRKEATSAT